MRNLVPENRDFFMSFHEEIMKRALILAEKGRGYTSPNPVVGAIVVKNGKIVGEGYHRKFGEPHAEIVAINNAEENAKDAVLYVNLEPCCVYGKTPPCTESIINAGIKEVYIGIIDPNPEISGLGIEKLKEVGIKVVLGILERESEKINRGFIHYTKKKRPWITLKLAVTADGFIADSSGKSKWITSKDSREFVKRERAFYDAVMVGKGTAIKDDPSLVARNENGYIPYRIVLDDSLGIPLRLKLVSDEYKGRTIIVTSEEDKEERKNSFSKSHIRVIETRKDEFGWIDLPDALRKTAEAGITSIYCEGGGQIAGSLVTQNLVNELQLLIAPKIIGKGIYSFSGFMKSLDTAVQLKWSENHKIGEDILLIGEFV